MNTLYFFAFKKTLTYLRLLFHFILKQPWVLKLLNKKFPKHKLEAIYSFHPSKTLLRVCALKHKDQRAQHTNKLYSRVWRKSTVAENIFFSSNCQKLTSPSIEMNSVILWISTTPFLKYYKLLEVLHAAQPNLSKLNHMILDCVFALMRWKWSRRSWNTWKPAHPTRREHLNQLGLVYLKARWGASYGQQLFYLSTGTL